MESKIKDIPCLYHPQEPIIRATLSSDPSGHLFCVGCLMEKKPQATLYKLNEFFDLIIEAQKKLPVQSNTTPDTIPEELQNTLSQKSELLSVVLSNVEKERANIIERYENLKQECLQLLESRKNQALQLLDEQVNNYKANLINLEGATNIQFEDKPSEVFGSADELIRHINSFATPQETHVFVESLLARINQNKREEIGSQENVSITTRALLHSAKTIREYANNNLPRFAYDSITFSNLITSLEKYTKQINKLESPVYRTDALSLMSSKILKKSEEVEILSKWIHRDGIVDYNLIYRGSEDGYGAEDFHRCCDNVTPLVVVIESDCGCRFGGFTEAVYRTISKINQPLPCIMDSQWKRTFLFSFDRKEKYNKAQDNSGLLTFPICSTPLQGASFGHGDLLISEFCDKGNSSSNLTVFAPSGTPYKGVLPGMSQSVSICISLCQHSQLFRVKEIEVFRVEYDKNELPTDEPIITKPQPIQIHKNPIFTHPPIPAANKWQQ